VHSGKVGAPPANHNAEKHGFYSRPSRKLESLSDVIEDLQAKMTRVSDLIDCSEDPSEVVTLFGLYAQSANRLGRLLRDQRALSGESGDALMDAIGKALDELSTELGIQL
jgi:hypothetical protein